jgi:hypothetical protein
VIEREDWAMALKPIARLLDCGNRLHRSQGVSAKEDRT